MKRFVSVISLITLVWSSLSSAETRPEFGQCIGRATDIVLVSILDDGKNSFRVIETWHGALAPNNQITVPGLGPMASQTMVLFLRPHQKQGKTIDTWIGAGHDIRTSVAWIFDGKVFAVQQPENPGPTFICPLTWATSLDNFKKFVIGYLQDRESFQQAVPISNRQERVKALAKILAAYSRYHEKAIKELAKCGPAAVDVLRSILEAPPNYNQKYAIGALSDCGGKQAIQQLDTMLDEEFAYWKQIASTLKRGWWTPGDNENREAWIRYGNLMALLRTLHRHKHPNIQTKTIAIRDFFQRQPVLEADTRITRMPDYCNHLLGAKERK